MATDLNCRNCKYWSTDMDMDAFCMHPKAIEERGSFGATLVGANNFRIKTCKFQLFIPNKKDAADILI